ncbi:NADP-dependent oxidoreductase [Xanthomonas campestris pv. campestris]|uniref:NADP-dependent oxidoreductase n=1 Tax=Xanthomonas campestris TaxID=339 RepID=UPI001C84C684|nr:NADP-dependent oxidoreductase [Xanthomonas campestris]MDM7670696.1 NADP-dependent oxidoreductase [Xanthomonas campestris pv. campestris]MDM7691107.1 NADP-dependent oxidoreductase [Xanthomonas campestris pv. campestris]MDM7838229.1 NADP-dependent oxidoreductase [Xanthomonas campestris pv. campestris]MDM7874459.1 NADP-dependent oxidoreductase [Xanthomonas campestris pv. campestris]MEB1629801.1 NADP-dependent oxidoreductase [Xanthomonas campestris pv. campestris]
MTSLTNRRIVLASRPHGEPGTDNFRIEGAPVPPTGHNQILVRNRFLSLDPYMRGRMDEGPSYAAPVAIDAVMEGGTVGEVLESNHPDYHPGELLVLGGGWQTHTVLEPTAPLRKLPKDDALPLSTALGVYGMPGFTAYAGLHEIGKPQAGETLVVAAASGPVGATVAQLARLQGLRVVAIAGGEEKVRYLRDTLRVDVALDHRAEDFAAQLRAATPDGIDVYFENVGGKVFDAVMPQLNDFARIPVCGVVATYNSRGQVAPGPDRLPDFIGQVLRKRLTVRGFIQHDFIRLMPAFLREMGQWLREDKIQYREHVLHGLDSAPQGLISLLRGENFGKAVVALD